MRHWLIINNSCVPMFNDKTAWAYSGLLFAIGGLIYLLSPILAPFLIAAALAYLGDPLVDRIEARGVSRTLGVSFVFLIMLLASIGALLLLGPALEGQVRLLINSIPSLVQQIDSQLIPSLEAVTGSELPRLDAASVTAAVKQHWHQIGGVLGVVARWLGNSSQMFVAFAASAVVVPVVTFYLLRDWDDLLEKLQALMPRKFAPKVAELCSEIDRVLAEFLRGQLLLMLSQAIYFSVALSFMGLHLALLVGLLAGAVSFVPYLGLVIGVMMAIIAAVMQFQEVMPIVYVLLIFGGGQLLETTVLQPLLVGDRIGLHPVAVIFAVMAGGQLFGFVGVLIALPAAAAITVLLRHMHEVYVRSDLYSLPAEDDVDSASETQP